MFHRLVWARNLFRRSPLLRRVYGALTRSGRQDELNAIARYEKERPATVTVHHGAVHCDYHAPTVERYVNAA
ncbi:MAG: hypothetical protein ABGY75_19765 [Gemmataceae bacterium]